MPTGGVCGALPIGSCGVLNMLDPQELQRCGLIAGSVSQCPVSRALSDTSLSAGSPNPASKERILCTDFSDVPGTQKPQDLPDETLGLLQVNGARQLPFLDARSTSGLGVRSRHVTRCREMENWVSASYLETVSPSR